MGESPVNRRKVGWIAATGCLLPTCCLLAASIFVAYQYTHDIIWVRLKLLGVGRIDDVELYGYDKPHYQVFAVGFAVSGKPGSAIVAHVYNTDQGLIGTPRHLYLAQLGPWSLTSGSGSPIDIGPKGEFGAMLPVKVRDINDLIMNYDRLVAFFASWPDKEHKRELVLSSGKRLGYYRTRGGMYPKP